MTDARARPEHAIGWALPLARAVPALALAAVITFSADHSAALGLTAFGTWAIVDGVLTAVLARRSVPDRGLGGVLVLRGGVGVVGGAVAFVLLTAPGAVELQVLMLAFAVVAAALEVVLGARWRRRARGASDWLVTGVLTALLALALAVVPADFRNAFTGEEGDTGVLTASIVEVGVLGAFAAVLGLFEAIAAITLRSPAAAPGRSA